MRYSLFTFILRLYPSPFLTHLKYLECAKSKKLEERRVKSRNKHKVQQYNYIYTILKTYLEEYNLFKITKSKLGIVLAFNNRLGVKWIQLPTYLKKDLITFECVDLDNWNITSRGPNVDDTDTLSGITCTKLCEELPKLLAQQNISIRKNLK